MPCPESSSPFYDNGEIYHIHKNACPSLLSVCSLLPQLIVCIKKPGLEPIFACFYLSALHLQVNASLPILEELPIPNDPTPVYTKVRNHLIDNQKYLQTSFPRADEQKIDKNQCMTDLDDDIRQMTESVEYHEEHRYCPNKQINVECGEDCIYKEARNDLKVQFCEYSRDTYPSVEKEIEAVEIAHGLVARLVMSKAKPTPGSEKAALRSVAINEFQSQLTFNQNHFTSREQVMAKLLAKAKRTRTIRLGGRSLNDLAKTKRVRSFRKLGWPVGYKSNPINLAEDGFKKTYFDPNIIIHSKDCVCKEEGFGSNQVKCVFCNLRLMCWRPEEDPISEHVKQKLD